MTSIFLEIGIVLILATSLGVIARFFKQPLILAYILTGLLVSTTGVWSIHNTETFAFLGELGIAFLLFLVGLELSITHLKTVGKVSFNTGVGQIIFTSLIGLILCLLLGFAFVPALYIGVALTFSSTVIVVKLLSEHNEINSLHGRVAVGVLLVQDLVALLLLIVLSGFEGGKGIDLFTFPLIFLKGVLLVYLTLVFSKRILPKVFNHFAKNAELLFIASISWCFLWAALSKWFGFSTEIGAFLAGLALATTQQNWQISSRIRPLRDLFVVIFFIMLGMRMTLGQIGDVLVPAVILSIFILVGNPFIVLMIMKQMGFKSRTAFLASVTLAQISEFSLILMALAYKLGHVGSKEVNLVTVVGLITISVSSYMILHARTLYKRIAPLLKGFETNHPFELPQSQYDALDDHIILVGGRRMGHSLLAMFKKSHLSFVVVDFDTGVVEKLQAQKIAAHFGDASDPEVLDHLKIEKAKAVISTIDRVEENLNIIRDVRIINPKMVVVLTANDEHEALALYAQGADYVVIPRVTGGEHLAHILLGKIEDKKDIRKLRTREIENLQERLMSRHL